MTNNSNRYAQQRQHGEAGFTLIELVIVVSIITLIMGFALMSLQGLYQAYDRNNLIQEFMFDTRRAKNEALAEGARVIFTFGANDYTVGIDRPPYDLSGAPDDTLWIKNYERNVSVSSNDSFIFDSRGMLIDVNGNLSSPTVFMNNLGSTYETLTFYASGFPQEF